MRGERGWKERRKGLEKRGGEERKGGGGGSMHPFSMYVRRSRKEDEERGGGEVEGQSIRIPSAEPQVTKALYFIRTQREQNSKRQSRQNMTNLTSH